MCNRSKSREREILWASISTSLNLGKLWGSKNRNDGRRKQRGNPWLPEMFNLHVNTKIEKQVESTEVKNWNHNIMTSLVEESCDWYWVRLVIQGENYSGKELPLTLAWGWESPQVPDFIPHSKQTLACAQLFIMAISSYIHPSDSFQSTTKLCRSFYEQHREYPTQPFSLTTFLLSVERLSGGRAAPKLDD